MLLRASFDLGYIPMSWRHVRVVFIPKPGKSPFQTMFCGPSVSCHLYQKHSRNYLIDISGLVLWVKKTLHRIQFAYRVGMSTKTALFQVVRRLETSLKHKEIALCAFLDIKVTFDNTPFHAIVDAARGRGLEETCCGWIGSIV
jgi:hypothetical protein